MNRKSLYYQLQRLEVGMVWLDARNRVIGFNDLAWQLLARASEQTLEVPRDQLMGIDLLKLHPQKSRDKLELLLRSTGTKKADSCPMQSPPPVTMMINIPDRVLLLKVSKMIDASGSSVGACMIYYDLTDFTTLPTDNNVALDVEAPLRKLNKIPVYRANRLMLVDLKDTQRLESNDHYTWIVTTSDRYLSNLSLGDLEERLDPKFFFRCHRSHIVNLSHVHEIERDGEALYIVFNRPEPIRIPVSRSNARALRDIVGLRT